MELVEYLLAAKNNGGVIGEAITDDIASQLGTVQNLMNLTDNELLRDVIAFPLNKNAKDLLMGAPRVVSVQL